MTASPPLALLAALAALVAPALALAQPQPRVVEVITATSDVHDIATSGTRTLLATSGGLVVREDGETTRVLTARDGLPGVRLRSVSLTEDGAWVGGVEGTALVAFAEDGSAAVSRTLALRRVQRAVRFAGDTWLATYGDGLFRLAEADSTPTQVDLGPAHARARVTDLLVRGSELWVATAGSGVLRIDARGRVTGRIASALPDPLVWDLEPSARGGVIVSTIAGVAVANPDGTLDRDAPEARASRGFRLKDVRSAHVSGAHTFFATFGDGVHRLDAGQARAVKLQHADAALRAHVVNSEQATTSTGADATTALLVGHDAGLARAGALTDRRLADANTGGLPSADVSALAHAFGALWVGTFDHGLARIRNGRVELMERAHTRFGVDARVNDLAVTGRGRTERLWIATDRGLYFHDGQRFVPVEERGGPGRTHVTSLYVDPRGALWTTSSRVLSRYARGRWESFAGDESLPVMHLHAVTTDARGRVWVGSLHGLYRFDATTHSFHRESVATGALPVDWVTAIEPWNDGVVIGTYHGGLSWHDGHGFEIERESRAAHGLPAGWVNPHAMRWLSGALFVGTLERGLAVGHKGQWTHLGVEDGLPSADVTAFVPATGARSAWVATRGGLARIVW